MTARPWLTLAIDVFTRMVVGFHLSMDKPSRVSIGLCMLNAVYDKSPWLKENEIEARWPAAGLPEALHADNGPDFRSRAFSWACREEGIGLIWRPAGTPHYGGSRRAADRHDHGARAFLSRDDFFQSRGAAGQRPRSFLGDDVPESSNAPWAGKSQGGTIRRYTARFGVRPLRSATTKESIPLRMPKDRMAFWVSFLPDAYRKLRPDGIFEFMICPIGRTPCRPRSAGTRRTC